MKTESETKSVMKQKLKTNVNGHVDVQRDR